MQSPGGRTDQFGQPVLNGHVDVFQLRPLRYTVALDVYFTSFAIQQQPTT